MDWPSFSDLIFHFSTSIFLLPFLDVMRMMSMPTFSFLAQLDSRILCLQNPFLWPMIYMGLSLELIGNSYLWVHPKQLSCLYAQFLIFLVENAGYSNRLHDFSTTNNVYVNTFAQLDHCLQNAFLWTVI